MSIYPRLPGFVGNPFAKPNGDPESNTVQMLATLAFEYRTHNLLGYESLIATAAAYNGERYEPNLAEIEERLGITRTDEA